MNFGNSCRVINVTGILLGEVRLIISPRNGWSTNLRMVPKVNLSLDPPASSLIQFALSTELATFLGAESGFQSVRRGTLLKFETHVRLCMNELQPGSAILLF